MSRWDDEKVGYGNPPSRTKFAKGQSGNPKGRPPRKTAQVDKNVLGSSRTDDIFRAELGRKVRVKGADGHQEITLYEAAIKSQLTSAAKGSAIAQRDVIKSARELEQRDAVRAELAQEQARKDYETGVMCHAKRKRIWDDAEALGKEPDQPWPHPDDVLLFPDQKVWTVRGPQSDSDVPYYRYLEAQRELMFWRMMEASRTHRGRGGLYKFYAWAMFEFDRLLPKRWQWAEIAAEFTNVCDRLYLKDFRVNVRICGETVASYQTVLGITDDDPEVRKFTEKAMKPLLKPYGYRSLTEFERAWKMEGAKMPWPKQSEVSR